MPEIWAPGNRSDLAEAGGRILRNLFAAQGHRAPEWIAARASCTHLSALQIDRIHYLLYLWYQFLLSAGRHVDDGNKESPYDLEWCEQRLVEEIASVDAEFWDLR
ncbi:hypothetical protein [Amycolatopsis sp. NPDC004079]|uniref:hypothetical protein n=1 Tax=Amycolatopsis sp. NPDC004079 TaxID=3154549 RepID=UPI0033A3893A